MQENGMVFNIHENKMAIQKLGDLAGEQPISGSDDELLRNDAFTIADDDKIRMIASHFREIMNTLGLDLNDESLKGTPDRVANMFVKELFYGLDPKNKPAIALFENKYRYDQMVIEKDITLYSSCEHHFVPIVGKAHVAYISSGKIIGLSKLNRLVQYFSKRPQVQERLTMQIANELRMVLQTESVAVLINAVHLCVTSRGIQDTNSNTVTTYYSGKFKQEDIKNEFLALIK